MEEAVEQLAQTNPLYQARDAAIAKAVAGSGARFADMLPDFNPSGNVTQEKARICALTFICSQSDGYPPMTGIERWPPPSWPLPASRIPEPKKSPRALARYRGQT